MTLRQMQTADLHVNKVNIVVKCSTRFPFRKPNHLEDCSILEQCLHRLPASWQVWSLHFCRTLMSLWDPPILNLLVCKYHHQILEWTLNNALYLSVNVLSLKLIIFWGPFFLHLLLDKGPPFYLVIWAMQRTGCLQSNGSTFNVQSF